MTISLHICVVRIISRQTCTSCMQSLHLFPYYHMQISLHTYTEHSIHSQTGLLAVNHQLPCNVCNDTTFIAVYFTVTFNMCVANMSCCKWSAEYPIWINQLEMVFLLFFKTSFFSCTWREYVSLAIPMTEQGGRASWPCHGRTGQPGFDCRKLVIWWAFRSIHA